MASGYDHGFGCRLLFGFIQIHFCHLTVVFGPSLWLTPFSLFLPSLNMAEGSLLSSRRSPE